MAIGLLRSVLLSVVSRLLPRMVARKRRVETAGRLSVLKKFLSNSIGPATFFVCSCRVLLRWVMLKVLVLGSACVALRRLRLQVPVPIIVITPSVGVSL